MKMKLESVLSAAASVLCLWMLVGCGSGQKRLNPATDTVVISQMKFQPDVLYVNKWDTVVWVNEDMVGHDVTQLPDKTWTSDTIQPGYNWRSVVRENTDYFCSIHPTMKGKVIIRE